MVDFARMSPWSTFSDPSFLCFLHLLLIEQHQHWQGFEEMQPSCWSVMNWNRVNPCGLISSCLQLLVMNIALWSISAWYSDIRKNFLFLLTSCKSVLKITICYASYKNIEQFNKDNNINKKACLHTEEDGWDTDTKPKRNTHFSSTHRCILFAWYFIRQVLQQLCSFSHQSSPNDSGPAI